MAFVSLLHLYMFLGRMGIMNRKKMKKKSVFAISINYTALV